jgi:hypothetical protein
MKSYKFKHEMTKEEYNMKIQELDQWQTLKKYSFK